MEREQRRHFFSSCLIGLRKCLVLVNEQPCSVCNTVDDLADHTLVRSAFAFFPMELMEKKPRLGGC